MYIVLSTYLKPLPEVDRHLGAHRAFLDRNYAQGNFIVSGPKNPRTGGVIVARSMLRQEIDAILAQDPFTAHQVAKYEVVEFSATKKSSDFAFD